jgi:copper chaperone CopZ
MITTYKPYYVSRKLKVDEMVCIECEKIISDALSMLDGVKSVDSKWKNGLVIVVYDLHKANIQDVEKLLSDIGYQPDNNLLSRINRDWIRFIEKSERDNLTHVGHCCSKPPIGA